MPQQQELGRIRLEFLTRRAQVDEDTAIQKVEISYVLKDKQVLKKLKDDQLWRYDPETKQWWIYSAFPDFR